MEIAKAPREIMTAKDEHHDQIVQLLTNGFMEDPASVYFWPDPEQRKKGHRAMFTSYLKNQSRGRGDEASGGGGGGGGFVNVVVDAEGPTKGVVRGVSIWSTNDSGFRPTLEYLVQGYRHLGAFGCYKFLRDFVFDFHRVCDQVIQKLLLSSGLKETEVELAWPDFVAADASCRGQGYGSDIMRDALRRCRDMRKTVLIISTNGKNLTFYGRHGFSIKCQKDFNGVTVYGLMQS